MRKYRLNQIRLSQIRIDPMRDIDYPNPVRMGIEFMNKILTASEIKSLILKYNSKKAPGDDETISEDIIPNKYNIDFIQFYQDCLDILKSRKKTEN